MLLKYGLVPSGQLIGSMIAELLSSTNLQLELCQGGLQGAVTVS